MTASFDDMLGWFKTRFRREAQQKISFIIQPDHTRLDNGQPADSREIKAGENYLRLWLSEMFLRNDRDWFTNWYPAVHSAITFQAGDQQPQIITRVAGAQNLKDVSSKNLDRAIVQDVDLTTMIPFSGGTVNISASLLAMKGSNDVEQLINVMADFSKKFALAQLSGILDVAGSLASGVGALVGATDGSMMAAIDRTLSGQSGAENVLRAGYAVTLAADEGQLDKDKLWVKGGQLHFGDSFEKSDRLTGFSYMLFRLECADTRDDFDSLSTIQTPFNSAVDMLTMGQLDSAKEFLKKAIAAAMKARELTAKVDRRRVIEELKRRFAEAQADFGAGLKPKAEPVRSLQKLLAQTDAFSVASARSMPTLRSVREALEGL